LAFNVLIRSNMAGLSDSGPDPRARRARGTPRLEGLITEQHLDLAELEFPGIARFFEACCRDGAGPRSFLELLARFDAFCPDPGA